MLSLQDISISNNTDLELESYSLISKDDSWAAMEFTHFEWAFGLDYRGCPFDSEYNVVKVSKDLIPCLQKQTLQFAPTKDVIQHAYDIMAYNRMKKVGERRNAEGLSLPRISSMVHPAIAILVLTLYQPDALHSPQSLKENVVFPIIKIVGIWPHWSHNRFKPEPTSKRKRRRSETSDTITCKCTLCVYDSSSEPSSSSGTYASDIDSSDSGERVALPVGDIEKDGKVDLDVVAWAQTVILPPLYDDSDEMSDNELLRTYAQESALALEQVKKTLKEENGKRNKLAAPTLEKVRFCLSKKRSRHS
uniref:Uncharacterized protein n=1 Tax=Moniliophthora roreri TaxID=221103 RepID=A0A0W0G6C5_MONRR